MEGRFQDSSPAAAVRRSIIGLLLDLSMSMTDRDVRPTRFELMLEYLPGRRGAFSPPQDTHGPTLSARAARHLRRARSLLRLFSDMDRQLLSLDISLCEGGIWSCWNTRYKLQRKDDQKVMKMSNLKDINRTTTLLIGQS
ncbi:hypothetical protein BJV77DRAFT_656888 [Russula vinacea]|nr:hypothetical protein BJV77DRAFT_656888 [Russula vinacea]